MKMKTKIIVTMGAVLLTVRLATGAIIDFEALAHSEPSWVTYASINEDGYTLSSSVGVNITGSAGIPNQVDGYKGSATAWVSGGNTIFMVKNDSNSFDLKSIDLARFSGEYTGSTMVDIIGYNAGGTEVASQSFPLPGTGDESLQTYVLNSTFSGIYKASWTQTADYYQVDNIHVIPEPASLGLIGLCAGGIVFTRRIFMV